MSLNTWMAEFMPVPADKVTGDDKALLTHCLRKWEGIIDHNLTKHDLLWHDAWLNLISSDECALCHRYYYNQRENACLNCPLYKAYGMDCNAQGSPYQQVLLHLSAEPMVTALTAMLKDMKEKEHGIVSE